MPGFNRYAIVFKHLEAIGKRDDKEFRMMLCHQFSNGRFSSLKDLTDMQLNELKRHLSSLVPKEIPSHEFESNDAMRKKILSICHEVGWEDSAGKIDWNRLDNYLNKYGYKHKSLNSYKHNELPTLVSQFEELLKSFYAKNTNKTKV